MDGRPAGHLGLAGQLGDAWSRICRHLGHPGVAAHPGVAVPRRDPGLGRAGPHVARGAAVMTGAKRRTLWIPAAVLAVVAAGQCGVAYALFTDPVTSGSATLQTAILPAPTVNPPTNAGCTASAPQQTNVANSWSGSAALDAAGNYLVSGYNILRSTSSAGAYSSAGSVSGGPPATASTDTAPSGATPPSVYVSSSTGATTQSINSSTYAATT